MSKTTMNWNDRPEESKPFPESVKRLLWLLQNREALTAGTARTCMRAANIQLDELLPWVELSHAPWKSYAESCLYDSRVFEIIVRSWTSGDFSAIHANPDLDWELVRCFGTIKTYVHTLQNNVLHAHDKSRQGPHAILHLQGGAISQMGNDGSLPAVSLHVRYRGHTPKIAKEPTRIFNLFAGEVQTNLKGAHFNIFTTPSMPSPGALTSDWVTSRRYYRQLRDRLHRILSATSSNVKTLQESLSIIEARISSL